MAFRFELVEEDTGGYFELYADGHEKRQGVMSFSRAGEGLWIINHTGVRPEAQGTGAAAALVRQGVEIARARNIKVMPLCPYARAQFQRHPEYADVLR